jgi:hypothetical protein
MTRTPHRGHCLTHALPANDCAVSDIPRRPAALANSHPAVVSAVPGVIPFIADACPGGGIYEPDRMWAVQRHWWIGETNIISETRYQSLRWK